MVFQAIRIYNDGFVQAPYENEYSQPGTFHPVLKYFLMYQIIDSIQEIKILKGIRNSQNNPPWNEQDISKFYRNSL